MDHFIGCVLKKRLIELAAIAFLLLIVTFVLWITDADRSVASLALGPQKLSPIGIKFWPAGAHFPWDFLYNWGPVPGFVMGGTALITLVAGFFVKKISTCRWSAVYVLIFLALGPGLLINVLLKDQVDRARPREVVDYGGDLQYTHFWQPGTADGGNSSFPSGHAAIAFFTIAPWFVLRDKNRKVAIGFLVFGMCLGTSVGIARILQGGHFVSDVVWAAGLIYLMGGVLTLVPGLGRRAGKDDISVQLREPVHGSGKVVLRCYDTDLSTFSDNTG